MLSNFWLKSKFLKYWQNNVILYCSLHPLLPGFCFSCWYVLKMSGMGENTSDPSRAETRKRKECTDQLGPRLDYCLQKKNCCLIKHCSCSFIIYSQFKYCAWFFSLAMKFLYMELFKFWTYGFFLRKSPTYLCTVPCVFYSYNQFVVIIFGFSIFPSLLGHKVL